MYSEELELARPLNRPAIYIYIYHFFAGALHSLCGQISVSQIGFTFMLGLFYSIWPIIQPHLLHNLKKCKQFYSVKL